MRKPSDFMNHPYDSVLKSNEAETVARNIMVVLSKTGDSFRPLNWNEYKAARLSDGNYFEREYDYFMKVIPYCASAETAFLFSDAWK